MKGVIDVSYEEIKQLYSYIAKEYDQVYYSKESEDNKTIEDFLVKIITQNQINTVLELGCGTGYWLDIMAKVGIKHLKGLDLSDEMLESAIKRCSKYSNVVLEKRVIPDEIEEPSKYDLLFASFFIEVLSEDKFKELLAKARELLNQEGYFIIVDNKLPDADLKSGVKKKILELKEKWDGVKVDCRYMLYSKEYLFNLLEEYGYRVVQYYDVNADIFVVLIMR